MSLFRDRGLFTSTCVLIINMKKCLDNYPGLVEIIKKYTGKPVWWQCPNEQCCYSSNYTAYFGIRSLALKEDAKKNSKRCMLHYCKYIYLRTMYRDITDECEKVYKQVKKDLYTKHPSQFFLQNFFTYIGKNCFSFSFYFLLTKNSHIL